MELWKPHTSATYAGTDMSCKTPEVRPKVLRSTSIRARYSLGVLSPPLEMLLRLQYSYSASLSEGLDYPDILFQDFKRDSYKELTWSARS